jgi:hypothetical protein
VRVSGPAFPGEPLVVVTFDGREVATTRARPAPDCTYEVSFTAPAERGDHAVGIRLDPPVRLEPPFDLTVE